MVTRGPAVVASADARCNGESAQLCHHDIYYYPVCPIIRFTSVGNPLPRQNIPFRLQHRLSGDLATSFGRSSWHSGHFRSRKFPLCPSQPLRGTPFFLRIIRCFSDWAVLLQIYSVADDTSDGFFSGPFRPSISYIRHHACGQPDIYSSSKGTSIHNPLLFPIFTLDNLTS